MGMPRLTRPGGGTFHGAGQNLFPASAITGGAAAVYAARW